jgi:hypothetical protein
MYTQEQYIQEAIQIVSGWPDIPDEDFAETVNKQTMIMSGCRPDYWSDRENEFPSTSHR